MNDVLRDSHYAVRGLRARPGFTMAVVVTLALGVGATTALFSVVYGTLLTPLPFPDAERLVRIWANNPARGVPFFSVSGPDYLDWKASARAFAGLGAYDRQRGVALRTGAEPVEIMASRVTGDLFPLLGASPILGRMFGADDDVVLSHGLWQREFGADPAVLGRVVSIDGEPHTVVGVMPRAFSIPTNPAELWLPLALSGSDDRGNRYLRVVGRLAPGATLEAAAAELSALAARLGQSFPATNAGWSVNTLTVNETVVGESFRRGSLLLLAASGLVLLIACANVASLLLDRAVRRRRETAVRAALGAGRGRLARQLVSEGVILALLGGAAGVLLAFWGTELLRAIGPAGVPRLEEIDVNPAVLGFAALASLGTGVLFGLVPLMDAWRPDLHAALLSGARTVGGGRRAERARALLVVGETGLALGLAVAATLVARSFDRLSAVALGFEARPVTTVRLALPSVRYPEPEQRSAFYRALLERVRAFPGVDAAAAVSSAPFGGPNSANVFGLVERPPASRDQAPDADVRVVTPEYFRTMGIRLLAGRPFSDADGADAPLVAVVSRTAAERFWPGGGPVGHQIRVADPISGPIYTVVGVVDDARYQTLEAPDVRPMLYAVHPQNASFSMTLVIRTAGAPDALADPVRAAVRELDPGLPVASMVGLDALVDDAFAERRFTVLLFSLFAALAVALTAIGTYATMSHWVTQRNREIGIRLALGGSRPAVIRLVVWRGMALAGAGVGLGLVGAWAATGRLAALLYRTSPREPATFAAAALAVAAIAFAACYVPARRAARLDPMETLRHE
jgi:predicted permease